MTERYYSDRVRGRRARTAEHIDIDVWQGVVALIERGISSSLFAEDFPVECDDQKGVYACDRMAFLQTLVAEVPDLELPLPTHPPETLAVLDAVEFLYDHASSARQGKYHSFFDHHHLHFDRAAGQQLVVDQVNRLFSRNGLVYELNTSGRVVRLTSPVLETAIAMPLPPTRDARFDGLLKDALARYIDPDRQTRHDGLEKLWDAFERSKTVLNADKKKGAAELLDRTSSDSAERALLDSEMRALTDIGNNFAIRHHETGKPVPGAELVDYLFTRMYSLLSRMHPTLR